MMENSTEVDVLVIGAGLSGICASTSWLDVHPDSRLVILERDSCIGGVWNARRGYNSFWTQWTVGTAEFSDQAMPRPPDDDLHFEFFKAKYTTEYINDYVDTHSYGGQTLRERTKLSMEVRSVQKTDGRWSVVAQERETNLQHFFKAQKLIVASGLTSIPNMPSLPGKEQFLGQILHHDAFGSSNVLTSLDVKHITVLGAGKSSADMVYAGVKSGKSVSWILKASETSGPGFMVSPKGAAGYKNAIEIAMTRIAGTLSPSFITEPNWWTSFLHSSQYGRKLMAAFWGAVDADVRKVANFDRKSLQNFDKLSPQISLFWQNCPDGLLHHDDYYDIIAEHVRIYVADIDRLEGTTVCLKSGEKVPTDALLCGTGWQPSLQFFTKEQCREFGLPYLLDSQIPAERDHWDALALEADAKVCATFPFLAKPPPHYSRPTTHTPFRLYRRMIPLSESTTASSSDRTIVFIGQLIIANIFQGVECQSLWATAYLDGKLSLPPAEEQEREVALFTAWCRRRYLGNGREGNNLTFELLAYCDMLLGDLGLSSHRKGWFKDLFSTMWSRDFGSLRGEFVEKFGYGIGLKETE